MMFPPRPPQKERPGGETGQKGERIDKNSPAIERQTISGKKGGAVAEAKKPRKRGGGEGGRGSFSPGNPIGDGDCATLGPKPGGRGFGGRGGEEVPGVFLWAKRWRGGPWPGGEGEGLGFWEREQPKQILFKELARFQREKEERSRKLIFQF